MTTQTFDLDNPTDRNRSGNPTDSDRSGQSRLRIRSCGLSDTGYERPENADRFDCDDRRGIYVLADGIGSFKHGGDAAQITVDSVLESVCHESSEQPRLEPAIRYAHAKVQEARRLDPSKDEMGTTVVGLLFDESGAAVVAHAGDSRAYRLRDGELELLTRDHTFAAEMVAEGHLPPSEVSRGPWANVLTRAVGGQGPIEVDTVTTSVRAGDTFLLCSDGLTKMVSDSDIRDCLDTDDGPEGACRQLVCEALLNGGHDNITVLLIQVRRSDAPQTDDTVTVELPLIPPTASYAAPPPC